MPNTKQKSNASTRAKRLTEEELLAMPADRYMDDAQLAFFRDLLESQERELLDNASETEEHLRDTELMPDINDQATLEEESNLELRVREREFRLLGKIREALQRIEDGSYGYCADTGEPIGLRRLLARPTAMLSVEAQERHEKLRKIQGQQ